MTPLEGPVRGEVRAASFLSRDGDATLEFLRGKLASTPGLEIATLPRYDEVVVFPARP
jgi:hypothetical protein